MVVEYLENTFGAYTGFSAFELVIIAIGLILVIKSIFD